MSKFANLKVGDLVRTTMDGKITDVSDRRVRIQYKDDEYCRTICSVDFPGLISVEKLDPPFAVGDEPVYFAGGTNKRVIKAIIGERAWIRNLDTNCESIILVSDLRREPGKA